MANSRRGRPTGGSDARERIITAAQELFLDRGFTTVTVREIARRAGVHHSLVNYHFGGKDQLFGQVLGLAVTPHSVVRRIDLAGPPGPAAERLVATAVHVWDLPAFRDPLVRTFDRDPGKALELLRSYVGTQIFATLTSHMEGPRREERAARVATVMVGLFFSRVIGRLEPMASLPADEVVRLVAPLVATALQVPGRPPATTGRPAPG